MTKLERNLTESSIQAFILGLEIINKLSVSYRLESFVFLFCNAWELLLKATLLKLKGKREIFYRKKRKQPRRSLSLEDCLNRVFTSANDPVRLNIEEIKQLRDNATHLVIPFIPADVMALFQAGVINYTKKLNEWLGIDISKRVPIGMMALVYDIDPSLHTLDSMVIKRKLPADTVKYWKHFQDSVRAKAQTITTGIEAFYIPINLKLAIVKNPQKADIVLSSGTGGKDAVIIEVPKNPDTTHPHRQTEVVELVNQRLSERKIINPYDVQSICKVFGIRGKPEYCYKSKFGPPQYSNAFIDFVVEEYNRDPDFFDKIRQKRKIEAAHERQTSQN
ncbi:MAG TPA: DUF3644 domain-containing protein [Candidatus Brocadiia bacterium]|nr:DUF3644 domain-containing protein [Candidatus Brocadiales bacterium]